ncbi:MAG: efflux RND transporter periplasmic adaptor subunit [Marinifilaceae bacterium]
MQKRQYIIIVVSLVILATGYFSMEFLSSRKPAKKKKTPTKNILQLHARKVAYQNIKTPIQFNGRILSAESIAVVSEAPGKIMTGAVRLKKGSSFKKGDILFSIYKDEKELELKAQKSSFLSHLANVLVEIDVDYPNEMQVFSDFFNRVDSNQNLPPFPEINNNKLKVFLANRNILTTYYTIQKAELELNRHTVMAPFSGTITEVFQETGTYVNTGNPVATIVNTGQLEVEVAVDNDYENLIGEGDVVKIYSEQNDSLTVGKVIRKTEFIDANTQSTLYYVAAKNSSALKIGQYLKVGFPGRVLPNVMEIPRDAVFDINKVYTVENGLIQIRTIDVELQKQKTILFRGLEPGVQVVTEPLVSTKINTEAKILNQEPGKKDKQAVSSAQQVAPGKKQGKGLGNGQGKKAEK